MSVWKKMKDAVWVDETPKVEEPVAAPVAPVQAPIQQLQAGTLPPAYAQAPFGGGFSANEEVYAAISIAITDGIENHLGRLHSMAETMRSAIPDEAMRLKAAAAACGLTSDQINASIDQQMANVAVEKNRFLTTDVAAMNAEIAQINAQTEEVQRQIEDLTAKAQEAVLRRDELSNHSSQKQAEVDNITAVFEITAAKVLQTLDMEKKKVGIYIPQEIK